MGLSEYLMEAVASRHSGKYWKLDNTWPALKEFLDKNGFVDITDSLSTIGHQKSYEMFFSKTSKGHIKKGIPYSVSVYFKEKIYDIQIASDTEEFIVLAYDNTKVRSWKYIDTKDFFEEINE